MPTLSSRCARLVVLCLLGGASPLVWRGGTGTGGVTVIAADTETAFVGLGVATPFQRPFPNVLPPLSSSSSSSSSSSYHHHHQSSWTAVSSSSSSSSSSSGNVQAGIDETKLQKAVKVLSEFDKEQAQYVQSRQQEEDPSNSNPLETGKYAVYHATALLSPERRALLKQAVVDLVEIAKQERDRNELDPSGGRVMLGICAATTEEALAELKSWVTYFALPRGLLHGMDVDGVPVEMDGAVFIKYNTGGAMTFAQLRATGRGFDALWKPGDALVEGYDGTYRGIYLTIELQEVGFFEQYGLFPLQLLAEE